MKYIAMMLFLIAACGSSESSEPESSEQDTYDGYISIARRDVALNATTRCDPDSWDEFMQSLGVSLGNPDRPIIRAALSDACIEVRRLSADYSDFHVEAPPR